MADPNEAENRRMIAARQRRMAVQMSRAGESMEAIATRLGVTRGAARKMVTREAREFADLNEAHEELMNTQATPPAAETCALEAETVKQRPY